MTDDCNPSFDCLEFKGRSTLYAHEVAAKLGCSVRHVYDLVDEGKIRAINVAGANNQTDRKFIRIPVDAYMAFVRGQTL